MQAEVKGSTMPVLVMILDPGEALAVGRDSDLADVVTMGNAVKNIFDMGTV